ncbi:hypothetical protein Tco_1194386 [Tanacetum coccineum]
MVPGENPPPATIHTRFERFNKQNPHSFDNAAASKDAENRISQLEEIFNVSRQGLAVYKFEGYRDSGSSWAPEIASIARGQTGHRQQMQRRTTTASTSGQR